MRAIAGQSISQVSRIRRVILCRLTTYPRLFRRHVDRRGAERRVTERALHHLDSHARGQYLRADREPKLMRRRARQLAPFRLAQIRHHLEQLPDRPLRKSACAPHRVAFSRHPLAGLARLAELLARLRGRRDHQWRHQRPARVRRIEILIPIAPVPAQRVDALVAD